MSVEQTGDPGAIVSSLASGATDIEDHMPANPCNFLADFSATNAAGISRAPDLIFNGQPGQTGANVAIVSVNPANSNTSNPPNCGSVDEIQIFIGSLNTALNLGSPTNETSAEVKISGQQFSTANGFFKASLDSFDTSDDYMTGQFDFVARASGNTFVLVTGSYAGD